MVAKKLVDAKSDDKGVITHVKIEGNTRFTSVKTAIPMAEDGRIDAVVVNASTGKKHLRTRPDSTSKNNLDDMAED